MTDRDALLRAIAANPDDDTPRLIYADLLDELGGDANVSRARFIRLQIETHGGPGDTGGTWAFEQKVTEAEGLAAHFSREWLHELPTWCAALFGPLGKVPADLFPRGFVERVRVKARLLTLRTTELFDAAPVRSLEIRAGEPGLVPAVFACPLLARLKTLAVRWRNVGDDLAAALAACPWLSNLRELDLSGCWVGERAARILARADRLPELRVIRLRDNIINSTVLSSLAGPSKLVNLQEIDVRGARCWPDAIGALQEAFPGVWFRG